MGQRERKRRKQSVSAPGYERGRARDEAVRAALAPLAPGARPAAVTVASVVAVLIAVTVIIGAATNHDLAKKGGSVGGAALIAGLLVVAACGLGRGGYWGVGGLGAFLCF